MSGLVGSPTYCRVSENAVTERPPSELASSIPPGADNVQHYITGIKYSEARYNQVNLCTKAPHAGDGIKHRRETVLVKQIYIMQSSATPGRPPAGVTG